MMLVLYTFKLLNTFFAHFLQMIVQTNNPRSNLTAVSQDIGGEGQTAEILRQSFVLD